MSAFNRKLSISLYKFLEAKPEKKISDPHDKYKELYNFCLSAYQEQHKRYDGMSEKASRFIAILTLLIGAYGYIGSWIFTHFGDEVSQSNMPNIHVMTNGEIIVTISGIILFLILVFGWLCLLKVLRLENVLSLPCDDGLLKFYYDNKLLDVYYGMSKGIKMAIEQNTPVIKLKARLLK